MADLKLTDRSELAQTPASTDLIHVVDVSDTTDSASGTSKKVTRANLVGGLLANAVEDTTPQLGGDLDVNGKKLVTVSDGNIVLEPNGTGKSQIQKAEFTNQAFYDAEPANTSSSNATTINWTAGNKQKYTNSENSTLTFTAPSGPCNLLLKIVHAANTNTYTITWPNTVKWPDGTAPTLTQTSGSVDIVSLYFDGTSYHGVASLAFAVPA